MQDSGHTLAWTGPTVERTTRNGKRFYNIAFKRWLVQQASRPGVSVAGLAMHHQVNANQLRRWMRLEHAASMPSLPVIVPITVTAQAGQLPVSPIVEVSSGDASMDAHIEIELGGAIVRLGRGARPQDLRMVIEALRA